MNALSAAQERKITEEYEFLTRDQYASLRAKVQEQAAEIERIKKQMEAGWIHITDSMICEYVEENERLTRQRDEAMQALKRIYYFQEDIGSPPMYSVSGLMQEIAKKAIDNTRSGS